MVGEGGVRMWLWCEKGVRGSEINGSGGEGMKQFWVGNVEKGENGGMTIRDGATVRSTQNTGPEASSGI